MKLHSYERLPDDETGARPPDSVRSGRTPTSLAAGCAVLPPRSRAGFTLVELLTVVAIIAILAAILVPTTSSARTAAKKAKTRAQFAQWGAAIESFRQEYGYYPTFETSGAGANKVNGNTAGGTNLTAVHRFYETMVGTRRNGTALPNTLTGNPPPPQAQNVRRIQFVTFTDGDMVPVSTTDPSLLTRRGLLRDAFDNTDIAVLVDRNLDGAIRSGAQGGDAINALPFVTPPNSTLRLQPAPVEFAPAQGGIRAGVVFYCAPPGATTAADLIMSWK
jgi:prepilin-type N-terminal cleavage/methylation domain-containing protein